MQIVFAPARNSWRFLRISLMCLLMVTCTQDAPHDNPLDPESPRYSADASLTGTISAVYDSTAGLANISVQLTSQNQSAGLFTNSDAQGKYTISGIQPGAYVAVYAHPEFATEQRSLTFGDKQQRQLSLRMDALPKVDSTFLRTGYEPRRSSADKFLLEADIYAHDSDSNLDLEEVGLRLEGGSAIIPLQSSLDRTRWTGSADLNTVDLSSPLDLLNRQIFIQVLTETNSTTRESTFGPFSVSRFITTPIILVAPQNDAITPSRPTFTWGKIELPFSVTTTLEINRIIGIDDFERIRFPAISDTTYTPPFELNSGNYIWTLRLEDAQGNWSRSLQSAFRITPGS